MLRMYNVCITYNRDSVAEKSAVRGMQMRIGRNEFVGLVGESGSGKSSIANAILKVLPEHALLDGSIEMDGHCNYTKATEEFLKDRVSYIGQNFFKMLSQYFTIKSHHHYLFKSIYNRRPTREERRAFLENLKQLNLDSPEKILKKYPFELSGGMLQRIIIALALVKRPKLLIADEPTSAIDKVAKHEFIKYLKLISKRNEMSVLLISHDLNLIYKFCSTIYVLFRGQLVEYGTTVDMIHHACHPYTKLLLDPEKHYHLLAENGKTDKSDVCPFSPICNIASENCHPLFYEISEGHVVFCSEVGHA